MTAAILVTLTLLPAEEESSWSELRYPSLLLSGVLHPEPREGLRWLCGKDGDSLPSSPESKSLLCLKGRRVSRWELEDLRSTCGANKLFLTKFSFSSISSYSRSLPNSLSFGWETPVGAGSPLWKLGFRGGTGIGTGLPVLPLNLPRSRLKELETLAALLRGAWNLALPGSDTWVLCPSPSSCRRCGFLILSVFEKQNELRLKFSSLASNRSGAFFFCRDTVVCRYITLNFSSARAFWSLFRLLLHISSSDSMSSTEFKSIWGTSPSGNSFLQCFANSSCSHISTFRTRLSADRCHVTPRSARNVPANSSGSSQWAVCLSHIFGFLSRFDFWEQCVNDSWGTSWLSSTSYTCKQQADAFIASVCQMRFISLPLRWKVSRLPVSRRAAFKICSDKRVSNECSTPLQWKVGVFSFG